MPGPRWYVVAAKHRQCHAAASAIEHLGFVVFLPWVSCPLPKGARELRPMFGNYVFVRIDLGLDPWGDITRLPCVPDRPILRRTVNGPPSPVPDRLVERIHADIGRRIEDIEAREQAAKDGRQVVRRPVEVLVSIGAAIRLTSGPIEGMTGTVSDLRQGARLARIEIDGFTLPLWVPTDRMELLSDAA